MLRNCDRSRLFAEEHYGLYLTIVLKARREIESLEEAIDDDLEDVQLDQVLTFIRRIARLSITFEEQRHCLMAIRP